MAVSATGGVIDPSTLTMLTINRLSEGDYRFEEEVEFLDMTAEELLQEYGRIKLEVTLTPLTGDLTVLPNASRARRDQRDLGALHLNGEDGIWAEYRVFTPGSDLNETEVIYIEMPRPTEGIYIEMSRPSGRPVRELISEALSLLGRCLATGSNPDSERMLIHRLPF